MSKSPNALTPLTPVKPEKPLKAFKVDIDDGDDPQSVIVFARDSASARRFGASELNACWEDVDSCRRAPGFDRYSPGPVPDEVLIQDGWWFECHGCTKTVSDDSFRAADGTVIEEGTYVVRARQVFCSQECLARHDARERMNVAAQAALIELVESKFPDCKIESVHVYGDRLTVSESAHSANCSAYFTFPGGTGVSVYHFGDGPWVPRMDLDAFESRYSNA